MFWRILLDLVYPRLCGGCGSEVRDEDGHLCWNCMRRLPYIVHPFCSICGDPVDGRVDELFVCHACSERRPCFDRARSAVRYRDVVQELLRRFKYRHGFWIANDLSRLLQSCVESHFDVSLIDAVAFVPLYPTRRHQRGFNQAELLAWLLARRLRKPLIKKALVRVRPTATQTRLTAQERALNVRNAFKIRNARSFSGKRLLLVDDVMTTGATVNECSRMLKAGGATEVWVATVARG